MFSERDLRMLGQMKADRQDFLSTVSSHLQKSLLELRGLEGAQQKEHDATVLWRNMAHEEREARKKAEFAESQMKAEMQKMSEELRDQQTLYEQATQKYNKVWNTLAVVQDDLKVEKTKHRQQVEKLEANMEYEVERRVGLARVEAVEAYKCSEAFTDAVEEAAMPGVGIGMWFYRAALKDVYPDLDLDQLDEKFPQSLPTQEEGESSELHGLVIEVDASPDQQVSDLLAPHPIPTDEVRPEEHQLEVMPLAPAEPDQVLAVELETILPPLPGEQPVVPAPPPSDEV